MSHVLSINSRVFLGPHCEWLRHSYHLRNSKGLEAPPRKQGQRPAKFFMVQQCPSSDSFHRASYRGAAKGLAAFIGFWCRKTWVLPNNFCETVKNSFTGKWTRWVLSILGVLNTFIWVREKYCSSEGRILLLCYWRQWNASKHLP